MSAGLRDPSWHKAGVFRVEGTFYTIYALNAVVFSFLFVVVVVFGLDQAEDLSVPLPGPRQKGQWAG